MQAIDPNRKNHSPADVVDMIRSCDELGMDAASFLRADELVDATRELGAMVDLLTADLAFASDKIDFLREDRAALADSIRDAITLLKENGVI